MSTTAPGTPARPWLIHVDGELYGDYLTEADQILGTAVTTSRWDPDSPRGPAWTEPKPVTGCPP